ncbi:MAG TPA: ATP-binding protein, partial [Legionellaceae bacterium]|nr:ATP-binding protein [Legionellaceae bacterium]
MDNTSELPKSSTARIQAALLGTHAVLEEDSVIENAELIGMQMKGPVDIKQLPPTTINVINAPFNGTMNHPRIIGVNIEQHLHLPVPIPKQTLPNELDYYVSTSFESKMSAQLEAQKREIKKLAVYGMAGSGKTVLAKHYYRKCHEQKKYAIYQILNAENLEKWRESLSDFAERISVGLKDRLNSCPPSEQEGLINGTIQAALNEKTWCILIDNWDMGEALNKESGKKEVALPWKNIENNFQVGSGLLLVTTQHPRPFSDKNCALDLSRASKEANDIFQFTQESCQILNKVLETVGVELSLLGTPKEMNALVEALGYLPLALVQAGCYILWENLDRQENGNRKEVFTYKNYQDL